MTKRFTYRAVRVEVWQGNDADGKLGYIPWWWRPITEPYASRIQWHVTGPKATYDGAVELAKCCIDRCKGCKERRAVFTHA
jgi:predicted transcriptional regulator